MAGKLTKTYDTLTFAQGTSSYLVRRRAQVLEGQSAQDSRELHVDYYEVISRSPSDSDAIAKCVSAQQHQWHPQMLDKPPSGSER
jgi:asparaginyl-tRNA synthetase